MPELSCARLSETLLLRFAGDVRQTEFVNLDTSANLYGFIEQLFQSGGVSEIVIDADGVVGMDSTHLGLLARLAVLCQQHLGKRPVLYAPSEKPRQLLHAMGMDSLFDVCTDPWVCDVPLEAIPACDRQAKDAVLTAHRTLAQLNPANREQFRPLIELLEAEPD